MNQPRDVFVFFDGTDCCEDDETNVLKLYRLCRAASSTNENVLPPHYEPGVDKDNGMGFLQKTAALSFVRQVKNAYRFLSNNRVGSSDRLYIFGYSRGAVAAMVLAQMIVDRRLRATILGPKFDDDVTSTNVCFLGLFDPVVGYIHKFFAQFKGAELQPATNPAIHSYVEVLSLDERKWYLPLHSAVKAHDAVQKVGRRNGRALSFDVPQSVAQPFRRTNSLLEQLEFRSALQKTSRIFLAVPGVHGEVGGQSGEPFLSDLALDAVLQAVLVSTPQPASSALRTVPRPEAKVQDGAIAVGRGSKFGDRLLQFRPRNFPDSESIFLHEFVDQLVGKTGVQDHRFFSRWRKYRLPERLAKNPRLPF